MTATKPVTVRMPADVLDHLMGLSIVDDNSLADQIRRAASTYVERRLAEEGFAERVEATRKRRDDTLASLIT